MYGSALVELSENLLKWCQEKQFQDLYHIINFLQTHVQIQTLPTLKQKAEKSFFEHSTKHLKPFVDNLHRLRNTNFETEELEEIKKYIEEFIVAEFTFFHEIQCVFDVGAPPHVSNLSLHFKNDLKLKSMVLFIKRNFSNYPLKEPLDFGNHYIPFDSLQSSILHFHDSIDSKINFIHLINELEGSRKARQVKEISFISDFTRVQKCHEYLLQVVHHLNIIVREFHSLPSAEKYLKEAEISGPISQQLDRLSIQVQELLLTVAVVGPLKSGKSTTINALLGHQVLPSAVLPCTVIPTIVRHKQGQIIPNLIVSKDLMRIIAEAAEAIFKHLVDIRLLMDLLSIEEKNVLKRIEKKEFRVHQSPILKTGHSLSPVDARIHLGQFLSDINILLRIYARAQQQHPPILNPDPTFNPLDQIVSLKCWPVIEAEYESLKGHTFFGTFQIIDTPGKDEINFIPSIKSAVSEVTSQATAVNLVLSAISFNDAAENINRELQAAVFYHTPIYITANRINEANFPFSERESRIKNIERQISERFLPPSQKGAAEDQVFGIDSYHAFATGCTVRLKNQYSEQFWALMASLPQHCREGDSLEWISIEEMNLLQKMCEILYGQVDWEEHLAELKDNNDAREEFLRKVNVLRKKTRFDSFVKKITENLAVVSGQKILSISGKELFRICELICKSIDNDVLSLLMGEEEFKGKYGTLPEVLKCLKETIGEKIPAIMMSAEEELNKALDLLVAELSNAINIGLDHAVNSLENGEAQLVARNGFFRLSKAPSAEYIAEYPYLKAVKDSAYWHLDPQDAPLFQKRVKEYCQSKLTNILDKCREEATKMLKIHADDFKTKLFAVLTSACGNNFQQISNLTKEDFNVKIPYLSLPEEDYTDNVKATVMRRAWYYLWLLHDEFETGKVNLLSTKALRNQIKTRGQTKLLKLLKSSISNQCIKELDTIKGTISNYFNLRIHAVEKNLNDIQEARKKKGPAEMQKFLRVLPLRVKLEGLMAELEQVNHQIQQGFKLK